MKIVIPMSGRGNRFLQAGYTDPKPLIKMDGKPIIEHVVNMFPGETDFLFICSNDHLETTNMKKVLTRIAPRGKIVGIDPHKKGPVFAVSKVFEELDDREEVIVNYCDFSCYWDYDNFLRITRERNADGAIPAYKGFHPHMLGSTNYAFIRESHQWLQEIKEKEPFTDNRMEEYASSGTYYFKKGSYVKKYFTELMEKGIHLHDEYYVSLTYNLLQKDGLKTSIYEIQHMLQWGTPQDVEEYNLWSAYFEDVIQKREQVGKTDHTTTMIPLAGAGSRFAKVGYKDPKPIIQVSGKPMVIQASDYLPNSAHRIFICLEEHLEHYELEKSIKSYYEKAEVISISQLTDGQAKTCVAGLGNINPEDSLLISACDNGVIWNQEQYDQLINDKEVDVIVWTFRNHVSSKINPEMYGWVDIDSKQNVNSVSVKKPISEEPFHDHAIVGTFYYRKAKYFKESIDKLFSKNKRVNGEFYVDSSINELIEMGLNVKVFEVDHYICWGTPNDLNTFEYWQSFFHKCSWHSYTLEQDPYVDKNKLKELEEAYRWNQPLYR
ncbi:NTP transferase domain-containing protein [Virgibacillus necropolis]|uniref:NTP transferase domain-containing protein n=1 Tax=Virgibacillus necropolis TaxID=163877 RepID=UPI003850AD9F